MNTFKEKLLSAGFCEAERSPLHFYKETADQVAFILNITETENEIYLVYGFASTAFTKFAGDEASLLRYGVASSDINLREAFSIHCFEDEPLAEETIGKFYAQYVHLEKDLLLQAAKEKRKAFMQKIAVRLKPLGFKKTNLTWHKAVGEYDLVFHAQKSAYADTYYFNLSVKRDPSRSIHPCFGTRLHIEGVPAPLDWQLTEEHVLEAFLEKTVIPTLQRFLSIPFSELGKDPYIWNHCLCDLKACTSCWVEKNFRGTKRPSS